MKVNLDPGPFDLLQEYFDLASARHGDVIDLTIGEPGDDPPGFVTAPVEDLGKWRNYPRSVGSAEFLQAASKMMKRRFNVDLPISQFGAVVGSKEFITGLPKIIHLWEPKRDTVLYPAVSYPSYAVGAKLGGFRAVRVPMDSQMRLDVSAISKEDAARALCLWSNTPGNPAGGLDDLEAVAEWGRANGVLVVSDECYAEFTWNGQRRSIVQLGTEGVLALHSLSKRSNLAGLRAGFYVGDAEVVETLRAVRLQAGFMIPGAIQEVATRVLNDDQHVEEQTEIYRARTTRLVKILQSIGVDVSVPGGGFFAWGQAPGDDAWDFLRRLAEIGGAVVVPGEFYGGSDYSSYIRASAVEPTERLEILAERLSGSELHSSA